MEDFIFYFIFSKRAIVLQEQLACATANVEVCISARVMVQFQKKKSTAGPQHTQTSHTEQTRFLMTLEFGLFAVGIYFSPRLLILQVAAYFVRAGLRCG